MYAIMILRNQIFIEIHILPMHVYEHVCACACAYTGTLQHVTMETNRHNLSAIAAAFHSYIRITIEFF